MRVIQIGLWSLIVIVVFALSACGNGQFCVGVSEYNENHETRGYKTEKGK